MKHQLELGNIYPSIDEQMKAKQSATLFVQIEAGDATVDGKKYRLSTGINGEMMIYSEKTKRLFAASWHKVIKYALDRGLDNPNLKFVKDNDPKPKTNGGRARSVDYDKIRESRAKGNKISQIAAEFKTSETTVLRALKVK